MEVKLKEIGQLFCQNAEWQLDKAEETFNGVHLEYKLGECDFDSAVLQAEPDFLLSNRDKISISIVEDDDSIANYYPANNQDWNQFVASAKDDYTGGECQLIVDVRKEYADHRLSVYDEEELRRYLEGKTIEETLGLFDNVLAGRAYVGFEVQYTQIHTFRTDKFSFINKGDEISVPESQISLDTIESSKKICTNNIQAKHIQPEFFKIEGGTDTHHPWQKLVSKCGLILVLSYLSDYAKIEETGFEYKIKGYKTIHRRLEADRIAAFSLSVESLPIYFKIYDWLYKGGNLYDKITIVRNIVTLNVEDDRISLPETTFDSILSNYNLYEKKNVEQYIELRNKVAEQLRNYQKDVVKIHDDFELDFKKITFSFLTFAFTTAIVRVLAKNIEETILIPDTIICLLLAFCSMSCFYYAYARWERNKKVRLFDKQYNGTRRFYEKLLSPKEMEELFTDERNKDGTYRAFIEERTCLYDWVWIILNLIFIATLLYIKYFING